MGLKIKCCFGSGAAVRVSVRVKCSLICSVTIALCLHKGSVSDVRMSATLSDRFMASCG